MSADVAERPIDSDRPPQQPLANRTWLVTGASSGSGRETASALDEAIRSIREPSGRTGVIRASRTENYLRAPSDEVHE